MISDFVALNEMNNLYLGTKACQAMECSLLLKLRGNGGLQIGTFWTFDDLGIILV